MPQREYEVEGKIYQFPEEMHPAEAVRILKSKGIIKKSVGEATRANVPVEKSATMEFLRPLMMGLATGAGTRLGGPKLGTAAGAGAGVLLDQGAQIMQGDQPSLLESGKMLAIQEAAPFIVNPIVKFGRGIIAAKAGIAPESIDQALYDQLGAFKATAAQYTKNPVFKFIEDVFAAGTKKERIQEQGRLTRTAGEDFTANLSGRPLSLRPHAFGNALQEDIKQNFNKSINESNFNAQIAEGIANANIKPIATASGVKQVAGPIDLSLATVAELKRELEVLSAPNVTPKQAEFARHIKDLIAEIEVRDPAGNVVGHTPVSFRRAWDFKQAADIYGYERKELGAEVTQAKNISRGLNDDIGGSIPKWSNNADDALQAWENSKAIVAQREQLFGTRDASNVASIRNSKNTIIKKLDDGLKDPNQARRIILAGEITLPTGKVLTSNARNDYQGYAFGRTLQDGWKSTSTVDPMEGYFVPQKLFDSWRDTAKQESFDIIFGKSARRIEASNLLEAIARVSERQNAAGKIAADIRIGGAGVTLGAGLLTKGIEFMGTGSGRYTGVVIGASIGLNAIGRVLTNPNAARYLTNIIEGRPLGVSQKFALRMIMNTLQGTEMVLDMKDGTKVPGKIVKGGRFEPTQMPQ